MDSFREGLRARRGGRSGRRPGAHRIAVAFFAAAIALSSAAKAADDLTAAVDTVKPFAKQVVFDAKDIFPAPVTRWRSHEWTRFGEGAAIVLGAYVVDEQTSRFFARQNNHALVRYLHGVTHLGGGYGVDVAALLAVGGWGLHDERMMDAGIDALESSVFAAGVVTPVIKRVAGRARPIQNEGKHSFHPLNSSYQSFPSGHATNAFAIYTAIATRYSDNAYVPAIAYTIATSVAVARVHDRAHFLSDVLAGGMIGHAVAKSIVANHRKAHIAVIPTMNGVVADIRF